jgi:hypothetical protein
MENEQPEILDSNFIKPEIGRRRKLLPWWIKVFTWIFLIFGMIIPIAFIFGILGFSFQLSLYGLESNTPLSAIGLGIMGVFLLKGITAFALWMEKDWAIDLGQVDAVVGICICVFLMVIYPMIDTNPGFKFNFRLELLLLIPFLVKLGTMKEQWKARISIKESR